MTDQPINNRVMFIKDSRGISIFFGFNPLTRKNDSGIICWNDPATGTWEASAENGNLAGWNRLNVNICPQFIRETLDGVCAYQPGMLIEMVYTGLPLVWNFKILRDE